MLKALVAFWLVGIKLPLTGLASLTFYRPRNDAVAAYARWAEEVGRGGPAAAARAVAARLTYVADPLGGALDFVTPPAVAWKRQRGDCDDFAYLTADVLRRCGYDTWIVNYWCWNVKSSHVVCLAREGPWYYALDQGAVSTPQATLAAAAGEGRPPAAVAATLITSFARGWDLIGRWLIAAK